MIIINRVERIWYTGGLIGLIAGSSKDKLQDKVNEMNQQGWNLHLIHKDRSNLLYMILQVVVLYCTLFIWTLGSSELLVFEKDQ